MATKVLERKEAVHLQTRTAQDELQNSKVLEENLAEFLEYQH